jgi:hypothetical protein
VSNGNYIVRYFDGLTGAVLTTDEVAVTNTTLLLNLPDFQWDLGVLVETVPVGVAEPLLTSAKANFDFKIAPNPVRSGQQIQVSFQLDKRQKVQFELADRSGRALQSLGNFSADHGENAVEIAIPGNLPAGIYWVKGTTKGTIGAKAVVVE